MLTQVIVTFALSAYCGWFMATRWPSALAALFGNFDWVLLKNIELKALMGSFYQYIHVAFRAPLPVLPLA